MHRLLCLALVSGCALGSGEDSGGAGDDGEGDDPGPSGGGGGTGDVPDANCPSVSLTTTRTTPSIQFLIDRSLSMNYKLDAAANISRYRAVGDAVISVVGQFQSGVHFGASLFMQEGTVCPRVDKTSSRKLMNLSQIQQLIASHTPTGNTPTAAAFAQTAALFQASPPDRNSPAIIVLATDGFPNNCAPTGDPQADTVAAIASAHADGIRTYVLGIAGVGDTFLQRAANAGQGVKTGIDEDAKYFVANDVAQLNQAVADLIGGVASCEISLDGAVDADAAHMGTVTLDGVLLRHGIDWVLVGSSTLRLEGAACTKLKTAPTAQVEASFPCGTVILL
ncbi:MAG: VWA domain-containing protein [Deltaproteobacteria bacterium]|nr:VWA domain-containing protein [Deltaproteobacteria bacterium]MDQ3295864.1 VWA domain-containing protein [Myxococcota bacterium]